MIANKKIRFPMKQLFSRFVIQLIVILFCVEFVKGALLISVLPVYMGTVLELSVFAIGVALAFQYVGDNLFRTPIGWMIDRIGYRPSMLIGVLLVCASVIIIAVSDRFYWMIIACALLGVGSSPLWPSVITGATEAAGEKASGTILSVVYVAWLSGTGLGPIVINFFISQTYNLAFKIMLIMLGIVLLTAFFLPGKRNRTSVSLEDGRGEDKQEAKGTERERARVRIERYFAELKRSMHMSKLYFPAMFAQNFALGILAPVLTLYARTVLHLSPQQFSMFLLAGGAITVLFLIPVGRLVDVWGTRWFLHVGLLLSASSLILFTYIESLAMLYAFVAVIGIGYALIIPSWNALLASVIPKAKRGAVWGFFLTISGSGMVIGSIVSGKLWDVFGPHAPFLLSGCSLLALFILHVLIVYRRGSR